jgi:hypothetical protein
MVFVAVFNLINSEKFWMAIDITDDMAVIIMEIMKER